MWVVSALKSRLSFSPSPILLPHLVLSPPELGFHCAMPACGPP